MRRVLGLGEGSKAGAISGWWWFGSGGSLDRGPLQSGLGREFSQSDQVERGGGEFQLLLDFPRADMSQAGEAGNGLEPAEAFFDLLAAALAELVTGVIAAGLHDHSANHASPLSLDSTIPHRES